MTNTLYWLRRDLRLADNPTLLAAVEDCQALLPVYLHSDAPADTWAPGAASRWWLHHSLLSLQQSLQHRGSDLIALGTDEPAAALLRLCVRHKITRVIWSASHEPEQQRLDQAVCRLLHDKGIETRSCAGNLFTQPGSLLNKQGQPYRVFAPFWKSLAPTLGQLDAPLAAPGQLPPLPTGVTAAAITSLSLLPKTRWDAGLVQQWQVGENAAHQQLERFMDAMHDYAVLRDRPDRPGTSMLSPYLHYGEISLRQIVQGIRLAHAEPAELMADNSGASVFLRELGWREFSAHLLWHFPHTVDQPLNEKFNRLRWRQNTSDLQRWQQGQTGIPIIDAGMRQLWHSGWMHNRVRMLVASFLTKNLFLPWQWGARWFWDTLVDADLGNNSLGWQWVAGCGADAAPYFRIFNPVTQGQKFDPAGQYVRRWVPELRELPDSVIHDPWNKAGIVKQAGVTLGQDYPRPMVDLAQSRRTALQAFTVLKQP